ncbi:S-adenosyl-L-methionine-dependent methyltransferase, partial [Fimicolochytrium jonesii]|uniref:S-adenosyl-L-methionine-dependent methyltransferase n=1 Tax=Fimicolochytrium jonesii TaxID=1396493 RepID=UPI0022FDC56C
MALYNKAGEILDKLEAQKGTIRSLCLADDVADKKRTYALVCESLKYKEVLQLIIKQAGLLEAEKSKKLKKGVANVLVYDLLFGRGIQTGGGYKEIITKHRTRLQAELAKIKIKRKVRDNKDLIPAHIRDAVVLPRWVRVNTLVSSVKKVLDRFEKLGYRIDTETPPPELKGLVLQQDKHIPELLALPSSTDLHDNPLLLDGSIIIQDKASCFPAYVLNPPQGAVCIDACAAPGNKTSHLSAIMRNTGKIYAFDMDKRRLGILQRLTKRAGCKNIDPTLGNFLETSGSDPRFKNVEYILLDPSCSGSGIVGRMDHLLEGIPAEENDSENPSTTPSTTESRITSLATFQLSALLHALTFPSLKKVVYSTCSKHREENEEVVRAVLEQQSDFVLAKGVFEGWETRGWTQEDPLGEG